MGRGKWCTAMRGFGALTNGFSAEWWQNKHNMHHSFTNIDGRDGDIKLEPLYFLPSPEVTGRPDNPAMRCTRSRTRSGGDTPSPPLGAQGQDRARAAGRALHVAVHRVAPRRGSGFDPGGRLPGGLAGDGDAPDGG